MIIKAILHVDEDKLKENNTSFEVEMGWVEDSGISLRDWEDITEQEASKWKS